MKFLSCLLILLVSPVVLLARISAIDAPQLKTADPSAHVRSDGKMYVFVTHDRRKWAVHAGQDLVSCPLHDMGFGLDDSGWAKQRAWAPDCVEKNGKYCLNTLTY